MRISLLFLSLSLSLITAIQCVHSLKKLAVCKYNKNVLSSILQDLKEHKLNPDIQDSIKKQLIATYSDLFPTPTFKILEGHSTHVLSVAFHPNGTQALTGSGDGTARLWDIITGQTIQVLRHTTHERVTNDWLNFDWIIRVAFSKCGNYALTATHTTVRLWDLQNPTVEPTILRTYDSEVIFSSDGNYALTDPESNILHLQNVVSTNKAIALLRDQNTGDIKSIALSSDGQYVLTGTYKGIVLLWDLAGINRQAIKLLKGHANPVQSIAFSPNGKCALTGSFDHTARLWDITTGQLIKILKGHTAAISSVAFNQYGTKALTGSYDNTARLWDLSTGKTIAILQGHTESVTSVAFSSDERYVLTGSHDNTACLWDLSYWMGIKDNGEPIITLEQVIDTIQSY